MKALTIAQPYAHLIVHGDARGLKRVENRNWGTPYRGPLLIHAGKSTAWLKSYSPLPADMTFGAIIGKVDLVGCVPTTDDCLHAFETWPWLHYHFHADQTAGFWWILDAPRYFAEPVPYRGLLGLFDVPDELI